MRNPYKLLLIFGLFFIAHKNSFAQHANEQQLHSDIESKLLTDAISGPVFTMQKPSISNLLKEDQISEQQKDIPWRFGKEQAVQIDLMKAMEFESISATSLKGKYRIKANAAKSININFSRFHLSESARLYISNAEQTELLGAITHENNKIDSLFSIRPIEGDELQLILLVDKTELNQNLIEISGLVYGYRSLRQKLGKGFGSSGNCNVNANCAEGDQWADVKRSIAMILTANNTRVCTGTLINNVRQDSTPYLLSAAHCGLQTNSIFIFDYRSNNCSPNTDGSLVKSISGAIHRASSNTSDFKLFELSQTPPPSFKAFYSGWDARDIVSPKSTVLHHPSGDVMKISIDQDSTITSGYYNTTDTTYWTIGNWETGTTEGGSSGSSLFNPYQRIIGQLHGGNAACGNSSPDYFGKFSSSWDAIAASNQQLKHWLDPDNTGTLVLDGLDLDTSSSLIDVAVIDFNGVPSLLCDSLINPRLILRNNGVDTIYAINLNYQINNGNVQSNSWVGQLFPKQVIEAPLGLITLAPGKAEFKAWQQTISSNDQIASNDSITFSTVSSPLPIDVIFTLKTDNYGDETSWEIFEQGSNFRLASGGPYEQINGGKIYNRSLCMYDSCFTLRLSDAVGDGFNDPSGNFGNGYALIRNVRGDTLLFENNFTGSFKDISFCVRPVSNSVAENKRENIAIFPNPVSRGQNISLKGETNATYQIYALDGKLIDNGKLNNQSIKMPEKSGLYILVIQNKEEKIISRTKVIVK